MVILGAEPDDRDDATRPCTDSLRGYGHATHVRCGSRPGATYGATGRLLVVVV